MTPNKDTQKKIEDAVKEIFHDDMGDLVDLEFEFKFKENELDIDINRMYHYVDVNFDQLEKLSKLFGTKLIDFEHGSSSWGCETCDYGSRYELTISCREVKYDGI